MDSGVARRCVMKQLFERTSSCWVRYEKYVIRTDSKGVKYITAASDARPQIIDPLEDAQTMVLDALNVGRLFFGKKHRNESRKPEFCGLYTVTVCLVLSQRCPPHQSLWITKRYTYRRTISYGRKRWKQNNSLITFTRSKSRFCESVE